MSTLDSQIARMLLDSGLLDQFQYQSVQDHQDRSGGRFHLLVVDLGFVPEQRVTAAVAKVTGLPRVVLSKMAADPRAIAKLTGAFCAEHQVFPCALRDGGTSLWLAMADPIDGGLVQEAHRQAGVAIRPLVGLPSEIHEHIERYYGSELTGADPFSVSSIDLSLSDEEAEQETQDEFKVTDMSGKTLVRHAGDVREEGPAAAKLASRLAGDGLPSPRATSQVPAAAGLNIEAMAPALTIEQRMDRIADNQQKAARIIKALVKLCIDKGFFAAEEFNTRRKT